MKKLFRTGQAFSWIRPSMQHYWIYGLLLVAVFALWLFGQQAAALTRAVKGQAAVAAAAPAQEAFQLKTTPIKADGLAPLVQQLRQLNPVISFTLTSSGNEVDIDAGAVEAFPEWTYAINSLYAMRADWLWSVSEICMGEGKCGRPLHIRVKAQRQEMIIRAE